MHIHARTCMIADSSRSQGLAELHYQKRTYDKAEAMARRTVMVRNTPLFPPISTHGLTEPCVDLVWRILLLESVSM